MTPTTCSPAHGLLTAAVVVLALAGCASSSSTPPTPASSSATTAVIGPVILTPDDRDGTVTLGRSVVFDLGADPAGWDLLASNPRVLALTPGGTKDGATFNWGGQTLTTGKVAVVATPKGAGTPVTFIVAVTH